MAKKVVMPATISVEIEELFSLTLKKEFNKI
mgnify:CR=1 FL=1